MVAFIIQIDVDEIDRLSYLRQDSPYYSDTLKYSIRAYPL
jgi:hypothetical protein